MGQLDIFGSEIHEYLFVIEPDQKTKEKLIRLRALIDRITPLSEEILHSKPHISLCSFETGDTSEDYILTKANQALSTIGSFDIQISGPEIWKNGTIVLKVNPNENTLELQKQLSVTFKGVIKSLHLTIARNMASELLDRLPIASFNVKSEFKCESIYILKKKENKPYQLLKVIYLDTNSL